MKPYRDMFGNPLTKQDVIATVAIVLQTGNPYPSNLQRHLRTGYGKAIRLLSVLHHAGVITSPDEKARRVILKRVDEATNAALRQLKKGKKS